MSAEAAKDDAVVSKGLKGIMAADSSICLVNGEEGRLLYRGYNIDDLATHSSYEEVAYLLLKGELPSATQLDEFDNPLSQDAKLVPQVAEFLKAAPHDVAPMSLLRSAVSVAGLYDATADDNSVEGAYKKAIRLIAKIPTMVAAIHRLRQGQELIDPVADKSVAWNFMHMIKGSEPTADEERAMDLILILHAEHGFNASTFACRVTIATLTDFYSAITSGVGTLKGKLHGGANTAVLETLTKIGSLEAVDEYVNKGLEAKEKFMGFGHAVYKVEDPRAKHLKELSRRLGEEQGNTMWYDMSTRMEDLVTPAIGKNCNVDFYSASLQHYMGIPKELFTCIFAASRISGWSAHVLEQLGDNKIIRPKAHYVGAAERGYVPISDR
ncbi:citrate/2-methylcitrate synthase [Calycomorphotria hydatis]|uniref:Citrate synthase n=1 Tax=Calycomorphotria hydatis TaxID=2528027 RepID=A0A517T6Z1_9PLAN|nr:citrate/2-methylcitrate synthase [Calycomorphotria hydatis]QDT64144.1 Citrate synthase 2 [Calycomorphotria hydatis]